MNIWPWKRHFSSTVDAKIYELKRLGSAELAVRLDAVTREYEGTLDILTLTDATSTTTDANPYKTRTGRVNQIVKCYAGTAQWGGAIVQRLVNIRRAYQMPKGLQAVKAQGFDDADAELEYINEVLDANNINEGKAQSLVKEREFEGQVLVQIQWLDGQLVLRPRPMRSMEYEVSLVDAANPNGPKRAQFKKDGAIAETLEDDEFAFACFNDDGVKFSGNPEVGSILWYAENADRALFAWRKYNKLFAYVTPFFETESPAVANALRELIREVGWKIGMAFAANAKMSLVEPSATPGDLLRNELVSNVQMICGITGVEPQDIGFPDILSNRAVATEMGEPQEIAVEADVTVWLGFFEDLFRKIIRLRNQNLFGQLREDAVIADIKTPTGRLWNRLEKVFLPAAQAGLLPRRTFVEHVPGLDVDAVLAELEADDERKNKSAMNQLGLSTLSGLAGNE